MNIFSLLLALSLLSPVSFTREEYPASLRTNLEIAAWRTHVYFEDHSIQLNQPFSYLKAVGDFRDEAWTQPRGFYRGSGACETATLLYRIAMAHIGPDYATDQIVHLNYTEEVVIGQKFTITYVLHRNPWPADLVGIWYDRDVELRNDFTFTANDETNSRSDKYKFLIWMDLDGNFYGDLLEPIQR